MSGPSSERPPNPAQRLRSGLRRHGLVRRPEAIRSLVQAKALRFVDGNRVELFDNGHTGLAAMLAAIETAERLIHLETYILRSDTTGRRFTAALAAKARAGVDVRLLYDAVGSRGLDSDALAPLRDAGADVVEFNPLGRIAPRFAPRRRDHRKLLIVDGRLGFVGGLNIGDEYERLQGGEPTWRDAHVQVEGPVVRDLEAVFLESWFRADGPGLPWQMLLAEEPAARGDARCAVLADGPVYRRRRMRDLVVSAVGSVDRRVTLESPYFAPGRRVLEALARASRRGITVELLLAGFTDHPVLRRAARAVLPRLIASGVRVFEYEKSMMHGKVAIFDDSWAVVGTSNLDRQSFEHSYEVNLIIEDARFADALAERFAHDIEASRRMDAEALAARGLWERLIDWLAALLLRFV